MKAEVELLPARVTALPAVRPDATFTDIPIFTGEASPIPKSVGEGFPPPLYRTKVLTAELLKVVGAALIVTMVGSEQYAYVEA
jgi:hypothetical protein